MARQCANPHNTSMVKKARTLQHATENTRKTRHMYCIPPAAFSRVVRGILAHHGKTLNVTKISPRAIRALQRFTETSMVDTIDKARLIMVGGDEKSVNKTLTVKYLHIVEEAFKVAPGARIDAL